MRKPVVDYRKFRLSKLKTPEFSHLLLLLGWVGYFLLYMITENLIPVENCHPIHIALDDMIPFMEIFVIPYTFWYLLIIFSLGYFLLYNIDQFKKLQTYIIITQVVAMAVYIIYPSRQDLRPEVFPRDNFLTDLVAFIYSFDTNTGVFPSLHVGYSLGIASVWLREKSVRWPFKTFVMISIVLICMSICFIKQHSAADFFAALPLGLLAELIVFRKSYFKKRAKKEIPHA
ncbi:MAG: phosphatidic acid phosphatase [Oscillospiraceae bacterium]|nr:phosphatidic acid phosphatase [Oscillospiraceae bacterium]